MIKKINFTKKTEERKNSKNINNDVFNVDKHLEMLKNLTSDITFDGDKDIIKSLKQKLNSYKTQDKKKDRYDKETFIKYSELLHKLIMSEMNCKYCECKTLLMYANKREPKQWTLDRIDNSIGHSNSNTIISCLKCNLERRCKNDEKFLFSKQMRLIKKN
jgi:hypothetical protein